MSTMTLTEFLLARIAEDKASCEDIADTAADLRSNYEHLAPRPPNNQSRAVDYLIDLAQRRAAECEAKLAILDLHSPTDQAQWYGDDEPPEDGLGVGCTTCGTANEYAVRWPCETVRVVAWVYADHPDYQQAWAL